MRNFEFVKRAKELTLDLSKISLPKRNTKNSAGYDFYALEDIELPAGKIVYVKTGVKVYMEDNEFLMLCNRSSNPKKKDLLLINGVGIVDSDYVDNEENEGEIAFAFMSINGTTIKTGEKIGQGIFMKYFKTDDDIANGIRNGGFGSTGK